MESAAASNIDMDKTVIASIFSYTPELVDSIIYLQKNEYDSFYCSAIKFPLVVHEHLTKSTGRQAEGTERIDRAAIIDPYRKDDTISAEQQHSFDDYKSLMKYGLSPGHNTPAGNHYTTRTIWDDSFLMINMTPQEMTFNSGIWVLIEAWTRNLGSNPKLTNVHCFTGSVPDSANITTYEGITVNIPTHWYKCVTASDAVNPKKLYIVCFYMKNDKFFIKKMDYYYFDKFTIPISELSTHTHTNMLKLFQIYNIYDPNYHTIRPITDIQRIGFKPSYPLQIQMEKCNWFGRLIYSETLENLDKNWSALQKYEHKFRDLQYHKEYYVAVRERLSSELSSSTSAAS
jgi:DNA/RNA endonuclease G (NUC1)